MAHDLVVRGGRIVDGTGNTAFDADLAVTDGRIAEIGPDLEARHVLDADGQVVAPGFIDIHTHYDAQVFWDPALTPSCFHGVTSVIAGNCGFSIAPTLPEHRDLIARTLENVEDMDVDTLAAGIPWDFETFPQYLDSVARHGCVLNFGAYLGHTALRLFVMGDDAYEREASAAEVARMVEVTTEAIVAGAMGFATSLAMTHQGADGKPVPSRFASRAELEDLMRAVGRVGTGVVSVAPGDPIGIRDLYDLQAASGVPFTYGALLTMPGGTYLELAALNEARRAEGAEVWPQVTPRPLTFQMTMRDPFTLNMNPSFRALMAGDDDARIHAYADPRWRRSTREAFERQQRMQPRWSTFEIADCPDVALVDVSLSELAAQRGVDELEAMLDLAVEHGLDVRIRAVLANDDPEGVGFLLTQDHCTLGLSDAGAHVGQLCDAPQATDFLGRWVRDRDLMPLETAVRKLTGVQADLFGLVDRGYLREGAYADVVVFDPDTIAPGPIERVRDFPASAERLTAPSPTGVTHVLVNGSAIRQDGEPLDVAVETRPGRLLRPGRRAAGP